ncbi:MAG: fibronectin-binding protein [Leptospiraceae bacterium]|nr:fibronectin-binding protein [Leptospiraceae bacterium]
MKHTNLILRILIAVSLLTFAASVGAQPPPPPNDPNPDNTTTTDISGNYRVEGTNPDGSRYEGTCRVSRISGNTYRFDWSVGNSYSGTGTLQGNRISVDWGSDAPAVYSVRPNGSLVGTWANGQATENLFPQ